MTIETKELVISGELKKKVDMICRKVNGNDYLLFDEWDDIFINGYDKRIKFRDLEECLKQK